MVIELDTLFVPNLKLLDPLSDDRIARDFSSAGKFFLVTDFLDLGSSAPGGSGLSLAAKLAKLYTTPAPTSKFGFPVPTCCGATEQDNSWKDSWADFYANNRLRAILREGINRHGADKEFAGQGGAEEVVYNPSTTYGHSEYELGIRRIFGGFGSAFWREYKELVPKAEPKEEWGDRVLLYELYHHLNHFALFGGGYCGGAMSIMKKLISKYG
ncbi:Fructosamine/Ketosamine-3-kinase [Lasiosphaeria miniovina]|uniref:protein-ribulosamine 3-kinase n=1 Tax=Lasiosphaeria miniovina TaxID=1954250 RepID=A0AA40E466_9PEZI|nr:Fructosamine/Ketosamine-3-kinase [Lasiosphaeria miniovina]KAK0721923.1 Fructosamine/Ketosamine-3-kinase [Lasiosphaeria miniovina]